jgi:hypothetical protein
MATTLQTIVDITRRHLNEPTASFWSDNELVALCNRGIRDLQRAINDDFQDYFLTVDATNVSQAANALTLTGVPADVGIVRGLEPRVLTTFPTLHYRPKNYVHPDFMAARSMAAFSPDLGGTIWWSVAGAGGPVAAPTIYVAPALSTAVLLRLIYTPTIAELAIGGTNPIPGESDNALVAWTVAYAMAKQREDQSPDPGWLAVYGTEKQNILVSLTPRQTDEDDIAEALFEQYWQ